MRRERSRAALLALSIVVASGCTDVLGLGDLEFDRLSDQACGASGCAGGGESGVGGERNQGGEIGSGGSSGEGGEAGDGGADDGPCVVGCDGEPVPPGNVMAGETVNCRILPDKTLKCWGYNYGGQLGNGTVGGESLVPTPVSDLVGVVQVAGGSGHTCALIDDGTVRCWGQSYAGELGDGIVYESGSPLPVTVLNVSGATQIASYNSCTCARIEDGTIRCWGTGPAPCLENNDNSPAQEMPGLSGVRQVTLGHFHACALLADRTVKCWGQNLDGQIGAGLFDDQLWPPTTVSELADVAQVEAGDLHTCALLRNGTVKCWGRGDYGQLGDGVFHDMSPPGFGIPTPVAVEGLGGAVQITVAYVHNCARLSDGSGRCWGFGRYGQLGNGVVYDSPGAPDGLTSAFGVASPVSVALDDLQAIATESVRACAIKNDESVWCWGAGHLGDGTFYQAQATPVEVVDAP